MWCALVLASAPLASPAGAKKPAPARADAGFAVPDEMVLKADMSPLIEMLSTSDGGFPFAKYKWQVPDLESYVDVPAVQMINGLPIRFSAAISKHDIPFLLDFYGKEFVRAGLFIPPPEDFQRLGLGSEFFQLTALDTENLISYSVMFQPIGPNQTTVIMGQGYLQEWLKKNKNPEPTDFAPLLPSAKMVVRTHSEGVDFMSYATDVSAPDAVRFYRETLLKAGYVPNPEEPGVYVKTGEQLKVRAMKRQNTEKGDTLLTAVLLERRTQASAP